MTAAHRKFVVTCAPPNPNGDLHLGHLSGPFLGADVLKRYLAQRGHEVYHVSYTDDWSCYVVRKGEEIQRSPRETSYMYSQRMEQTLSLANMLPDYYEHPHREKIHEQTVQELFGELQQRNAFVATDTRAFYCENCQRFLYEAHIRGVCQYCEAPSDGFYCEECGRPQEPAGLKKAVCIRCKQPPSIRLVPRVVFPLDQYSNRLSAYYEQAPWRPRLKSYLQFMLQQGLPPTPVSRLTNYGVSVPSGWEGHILDTWYSGIFGYIASTRAYGNTIGKPDLWKELWKDPRTEIAHFIGFDCSFSHAILWPALLMAHGEFTLPAYIIPNEFYRLEGAKFSTSRGHAIWGSEFLRQVPADMVRLYLALTGPEREQTNFKMDDFREFCGKVLVDDLESWVESLFDLLRTDCALVVPAMSNGHAPETIREITAGLADQVAQHLEPTTFSPQEASRALVKAITLAAENLREIRASRSSMSLQTYREALAAHVQLLGVMACAAAPLIPSWSERMWRALQLPFEGAAMNMLPWPKGNTPLVSAGHQVLPPMGHMFHKI